MYNSRQHLADGSRSNRGNERRSSQNLGAEEFDIGSDDEEEGAGRRRKGFIDKLKGIFSKKKKNLSRSQSQYDVGSDFPDYLVEKKSSRRGEASSEGSFSRRRASLTRAKSLQDLDSSRAPSCSEFSFNSDCSSCISEERHRQNRIERRIRRHTDGVSSEASNPETSGLLGRQSLGARRKEPSRRSSYGFGEDVLGSIADGPFSVHHSPAGYTHDPFIRSSPLRRGRSPKRSSSPFPARERLEDDLESTCSHGSDTSDATVVCALCVANLRAGLEEELYSSKRDMEKLRAELDRMKRENDILKAHMERNRHGGYDDDQENRRSRGPLKCSDGKKRDFSEDEEEDDIFESAPREKGSADSDSGDGKKKGKKGKKKRGDGSSDSSDTSSDSGDSDSSNEGTHQPNRIPKYKTDFNVNLKEIDLNMGEEAKLRYETRLHRYNILVNRKLRCQREIEGLKKLNFVSFVMSRGDKKLSSEREKLRNIDRDITILLNSFHLVTTEDIDKDVDRREKGKYPPQTRAYTLDDMSKMVTENRLLKKTIEDLSNSEDYGINSLGDGYIELETVESKTGRHGKQASKSKERVEKIVNRARRNWEKRRGCKCKGACTCADPGLIDKHYLERVRDET